MRIRRLLLLVAAALPLFGAYSYYFTDTFSSINTTNWLQNGTVSGSAIGLTTTNVNGGSVLSKIAIPDGTIEAQLKVKYRLQSSGGNFIVYGQASDSAIHGPTSDGKFRAVELSNVVVSGGSCTATLTAWDRVFAVVTNLGSTSINCWDNMELKVVMHTTAVQVFRGEDELLYATGYTYTTGKVGVGVRNSPSNNSIAQVSLGALDRTAPPAISSANVATWATPTTLSLQFPGVADDANGVGIWRYNLYINGAYTTSVLWPEAVLTGLTAGTTYTIGIAPQDRHWNQPATTTMSVAMPATGTQDPRNVGITNTTAFWGAGSENIDMRSGNLNFSLPLLAAKKRNGGGASLGLSYNSQVWRNDGTSTFNFGRDVGYGFGWRLALGSIVPMYSGGFTINYYLFTDSTGAEYKLTVNTGNVWTSPDIPSIAYDANQLRIYNKIDGTFWYMGCLSEGTEQDVGTRYPTVIQDTNGNQVFLNYKSGTNTSWPNSSARIDSVEDVRAPLVLFGGAWVYRTYTFTYNADTIPHLTRIDSQIGSGESFDFTYSALQTLTSPFTPTVNLPNSKTLATVVQVGTNLTHTFTHNGNGELTKVQFPLGGDLEWVYRTFTYSGSRKYREVQTRKLRMEYGSPTQHQYAITRDDAGDASKSTHAWTKLDDAGGVGRKQWFFETNTASAYFGRPTQFDEISLPSTVKRRSQYTYQATGGGVKYVSSELNINDVGAAFVMQSKVEQDVNDDGLPYARRVYQYSAGSPTVLAATYRTTFVTDSNYTSRYMRGLVLTRDMKLAADPSWTLIVQNTYDNYAGGNSLVNRTGLREHDSANYGTGVTYRGNATSVEVPGRIVTTRFDITGMAEKVTQGATSIQVTPTSNNTVPYQITPNSTPSLTTTMSWNSFLGLTQESGPNGAVKMFSYDSWGRNNYDKSPHGAETDTTFSLAGTYPAYTTTTVDNGGGAGHGRWTKTTVDGFGRPIKVETGYSSTTVSTVETTYAPCACSPLGKVSTVSRPYAPLGTKYWTTYTYDALGRTVTTALPNSAGSTTYLYEGNTVKTTDPAGKWKKFTMDAMGNLTQVNEPNPAGGADLVTTYTYNVGNRLTQVSMTRGASTQTRTFNYNGDDRLASMTQPETGTTTFTYNSDSTLATKVDAKNQKLAFTYDSLKRVTDIAKHPTSGGAEDACQHVTFSYDTNPHDGAYSSNIAGRLAAVRWGGTGCGASAGGGRWTEMYSYTSAGLPTKKRLDLSRGVNTVTLDSSNTFDNEGRLTNFTYPLSADNYQHGFDSMSRLLSLTNVTTSTTLANGAAYNAASQLIGLNYGPSLGWAETRTYNTLGQITRITVPSVVDMEYTFSTSNNNGRITKQKDWISGEEVNYTYDSLNRLLTAATTSATWGLSFGYDGFGNKLSQTVTKGSAPPMSVTVDASTNRLIGSTYDSNGNLTVGSGMNLSYDISNRILTAAGPSSEWYAYAPGNKRVWKKRQTGGSTYEENVYFYSASGQRFGTYTLTDTSGTLALTVKSTNLYFGGKLIKEGTTWVAMDRLGSVRARHDGALTSFDHFPYGEEKPSTTTQDRNKFATYFRDHTNLDYADQRYYTSAMGRFMTPDPLDVSSGSSGNLATYALGDPVNLVDPTGQAPADLIGLDGAVDYGCLDSFTGLPTPLDASNTCQPGSLWFSAGGINFRRSRLNTIADLTEQLTPFIEDWDYAEPTGNNLNITFKSEFAAPVLIGIGTGSIVIGTGGTIAVAIGAGGVVTISVIALRHLPGLIDALKRFADKPTTIELGICYIMYIEAKNNCQRLLPDIVRVAKCLQSAQENYRRCTSGEPPLSPLDEEK